MKTDRISFSFVSAVIVAGVFLALFGPAHSAKPAAQPAPPATTAGVSE